MEQNHENRVKLQQSIEKVLESREIDESFINQKSLDEILEEFSIYHQELEYQNEELRRIQADLEQSKDHYAQLFNDAPVAYVMVNRDQEILEANHLFCEWTGIEEGFLKNRKIQEWISPESQDPFYFHMRTVFQTGKRRGLKLMMAMPDGNKPVKIQSNRMKKDIEQEFVRIAIVDVSREKQMEEAMLRQNKELEVARKKAECASQAKSQFLANMSHEIRTPLNGMVGFLQLMQETKMDSEQREYLSYIHSSAQSLVKLLADILALSSIEAKEAMMYHQCFSIVDLLLMITEKHRYDIANKQVTIDLHYDEKIPEEVLGAQSYLQQILNNLMENALRFTEEGKIILEAKVLERTKEQVVVEFLVKDTGIGIREEDQHLIFESFTQVDNSNTRKYGGSGLGLTISKRLVEVMGGSIRIESQEGVGSCFAVTLPFESTVSC